jgi:ATP-dependent NAD(P)H-hydrate dehydratase
MLNAAEKVIHVFSRLDVLLIGPGLGRNPMMLDIAKRIIKSARERELPMVIDGDGLFLIQQWPELLKGYPHAVFTPNANEFNRLCHLAGIDPGSLIDKDIEAAILDTIRPLSHYFGVTILRKGMVDTAAYTDTGSSFKKFM